MPDLGAYFSTIQTEKNRLDKLYPSGCVHVISIRNMNAGSTAGVVSEVSTRIAAKHLAENTARIATESEVSEFRASGAAFSARMATQKFNRQKADSSGVTITLNRGTL